MCILQLLVGCIECNAGPARPLSHPGRPLRPLMSP
jgi:hypothetical protein